MGSRTLACRPVTGLWLPAATRAMGPGDRPGKALLAHRIYSASIPRRCVGRSPGRVNSRHQCVALTPYLAQASLSESRWLTPPRPRPLDGSFGYRPGAYRSSAPGAWSCLYLAAPPRLPAVFVSSAGRGNATCAPLNARSLRCGPSAEFQRYAGHSSAALRPRLRI